MPEPPGPVLLQLLEFNAHRIALEVPFAETIGVPPGKPKKSLPESVGVAESLPLVTAKAFR